MRNARVPCKASSVVVDLQIESDSRFGTTRPKIGVQWAPPNGTGILHCFCRSHDPSLVVVTVVSTDVMPGATPVTTMDPAVPTSTALLRLVRRVVGEGVVVVRNLDLEAIELFGGIAPKLTGQAAFRRLYRQPMLLVLWPSFVVTIVVTDPVSGGTPTTVIEPL